jgi:hypothetical protein
MATGNTPSRPRRTRATPAASAAAATAAATTGGGVTFDFVYNGVTYTVQVYAPDSNSQYGFKVTQGATVVSALTYKDDQNWQIQVGLPGTFKVDNNLTINALTVNIENGTVAPLS